MDGAGAVLRSGRNLMIAGGTRRQSAVALMALAIQAPGAGAFTFQFTFGSCTLDTAAHTFSSNREPRIQTPLTLSAGEMATIAEGLDRIDFFGYPSTFVGVPLGLRAYSIDAAATSYRLEVERQGQAHVVSWMDSTRPTTEAADRLRDLFAQIVRLIGERHGLEPLQHEGGDCR